MVGRNPDNPKSRVVGLPTVQMLEKREGNLCGTITTVTKDNLVLVRKSTKNNTRIQKESR